MKLYFTKTPKIVKWIYPKRIWSFNESENTIFLSFDDGPIPEVTPWVLEQLRIYNAKATFFCIGDNVQKHPTIFETIIAEGHTIGNHTFNHLNGWKTKANKYLENCILYENSEFITQNSKLFRPPFGKLTSKQSDLLQKKGYKIIMWDVLSADFDTSVSEEKCLQNVLKNTKKGSIVVFHDSLKAKTNLYFTLPKVLAYFTKKGFEFKCIPSLNQ